MVTLPRVWPFEVMAVGVSAVPVVEVKERAEVLALPRVYVISEERVKTSPAIVRVTDELWVKVLA